MIAERSESRGYSGFFPQQDDGASAAKLAADNGAALRTGSASSVGACGAGDADWYQEELRALLGRLSPPHAKALTTAGGAAALFARLVEEATAQLPEFMQRRPKYYHFFNWMRERITLALGAAPEEARPPATSALESLGVR